MKVEAKIVATRGFSHIESEKFSIPISGGGKWEVAPESLSEFAVGGKKRVVIRNTMGSCKCLQAVKYKPSFGWRVYIRGKCFIKIRSDSAKMGPKLGLKLTQLIFKPGQGAMELKAYGNNQQPQRLQVKLYPSPPKITKLLVHKGDNKVAIEGERIDQIKTLSINGKLAQLEKGKQKSSARYATHKKCFVFQNKRDLILSKRVAIKMTLDGNRKI